MIVQQAKYAIRHRVVGTAKADVEAEEEVDEGVDEEMQL